MLASCQGLNYCFASPPLPRLIFVLLSPRYPRFRTFERWSSSGCTKTYVPSAIFCWESLYLPLLYFCVGNCLQRKIKLPAQFTELAIRFSILILFVQPREISPCLVLLFLFQSSRFSYVISLNTLFNVSMKQGLIQVSKNTYNLHSVSLNFEPTQIFNVLLFFFFVKH